MNKTINLVSNLGITLLASSLLANPVKASGVLESKSESLEAINSNTSEILISQDLGHDEYDGLPQMEWGNYLLGTVVGDVGDIKFVVLPDGTHFHGAGAGYPGGNVLVEEIDGNYYIVEDSHSRWITILQSDYGWRNVRRIEPTLLERTAPIWAQLESSSSSSVTIPPRTSTPSYTPVEQPTMDEPVRGLY